jgi:VWFA-related protein
VCRTLVNVTSYDRDVISLTTLFVTLVFAIQNIAPAVTNVDFLVTSSDGTPVLDIKPADVTIKIDGKTRTIQSLRLISVVDVPQTDAPYVTNGLTSDGRSLVIAIDEQSFRTGREHPMREAVSGLLARLGPRDRVLLVTMPFGIVKVPFTTDHARVKRAIDITTGQRPQNETGSEMACRTRRVLEGTAAFLDLLRFAEGPTSVVFFTGGMVGPRRDAVATMSPGMCELRVEEFARVGRAAAAGRANFYVVHPDDMATPAVVDSPTSATFVGSVNPYEGIEHLAGITGGRRLPLSAAGPVALARVVRETAAYYVADLIPEPNDRDGRIRQFNVRVERTGATSSFRPQVAFGPARPAATSTPELTANVREMLLSTAPFPALPLRAAAYTSIGSGGKVKVVALAEPGDPNSVLTGLSAGLINAEGRVVAQWTAADPAEIPLSGAMLVDPGAYRLRVAATGKDGRAGAVDYLFDAALTRSGSLQFSSLVLGVSRQGAVIPKLQFGPEPVALASLEFEGTMTGSRLTIGLEVARATDAPAILTAPLAVERVGDDHYAATGALAIGALPPGDYSVRAVVGLDGKEIARVTRTLRKASR